MGRKRRKRLSCPNCSQELKQHMNYCFNCGQENHIKRVSLKMLFADFISTYISVDSKILRSLKLLIIKPSFLSLEYLNGRIEAYLRPIRLYVFISFSFFLLLGVTSTSDPDLTDDKGIIKLKETPTKEDKETAVKTLDSVKKELPKEFEAVVNEAKDNINVEKANKDRKDDDSLINAMDSDLGKKLELIFNDKREQRIFYNYFISKLPILLFIIIPVFACILFLMFYNKSYYYVDHLVFAMHLQAFLFVMLIITTIIDFITGSDLAGLAFLAFLIYGFIAAKRFYKRSIWGTLWRLSLTGIFHSILSIAVLFVFFLIVVKYYHVP